VGGLLANGFIQATNALTSAFTSIIDGTKRAKDAWKDFGIATLRIIAQILARIAALKIAQTVLGLADGGVLPGVTDENASLPVRGYARGGVARSPQLAVFGEGSTAEAFVPLPDNRSIPVTINGGYGMGSQQVNLNVYAWDSKDAARGLYENRQVLQSIFTSQADNLVSMRQTIQRATR
jgi:SLT domain-containing protein